jgi:hypothetical protein
LPSLYVRTHESQNRLIKSLLLSRCDGNFAILKIPGNPNHKRFPKPIIEGLYPNQQKDFDRGDKFADYQQLASLEEYVLVNTKRQRLDFVFAAMKRIADLKIIFWRKREIELVKHQF